MNGPRSRPRWRRLLNEAAGTVLVLAALVLAALVFPEPDTTVAAQRTAAAAVDGTLERPVAADTASSALRRTASVYVSEDLVVVAERKLRYRRRSCVFTVALPGRDPYQMRAGVGGCRAASAVLEDGTLHSFYYRPPTKR